MGDMRAALWLTGAIMVIFAGILYAIDVSLR
jgi:hypothetical protein